MIKRNHDSDINREYLFYLMNDVGLLNDYQLHDIGISFDEYDNPNEEVLDKIEKYRDKKKDNC